MRRHEFDVTSLVAGLVFVAIAAAYLVSSFTSLHVDAGWVLPFGLVGLGLAGVIGSLARARRAEEPVTEPVIEPVTERLAEPAESPAQAVAEPGADLRANEDTADVGPAGAASAEDDEAG
jgi:hypothetical protein